MGRWVGALRACENAGRIEVYWLEHSVESRFVTARRFQMVRVFTNLRGKLRGTDSHSKLEVKHISLFHQGLAGLVMRLVPVETSKPLRSGYTVGDSTEGGPANTLAKQRGTRDSLSSVGGKGSG